MIVDAVIHEESTGCTQEKKAKAWHKAKLDELAAQGLKGLEGGLGLVVRLSYLRRNRIEPYRP